MLRNIKAYAGRPAAGDVPCRPLRPLFKPGPLAVLALALLLVAPAMALGATTTGYNQTPPPPTTGYTQTPPPPTTPTNTTTTYKQTPTTPKQGVAPKREEGTRTTTTSSTSTHEVGPSTAREESTTTHPRASTLPFTGLDLRWVVFGGVLLFGSGLSLMLAQRKRARAGGR